MRLVSICLKLCAIVALALTLATQVFAAVHQQHNALGMPALTLGVVKFYGPWQGVQWARWWWSSNPALFLWAGIAGGGAVLLLTSVWIAAALGHFQQEAKENATLATGAELRKAKLLRKDGVVVGKR